MLADLIDTLNAVTVKRACSYARSPSPRPPPYAHAPQVASAWIAQQRQWRQALLLMHMPDTHIPVIRYTVVVRPVAPGTESRHTSFTATLLAYTWATRHVLLAPAPLLSRLPSHSLTWPPGLGCWHLPKKKHADVGPTLEPLAANEVIRVPASSKQGPSVIIQPALEDHAPHECRMNACVLALHKPTHHGS